MSDMALKNTFTEIEKIFGKITHTYSDRMWAMMPKKKENDK